MPLWPLCRRIIEVLRDRNASRVVFHVVPCLGPFNSPRALSAPRETGPFRCGRRLRRGLRGPPATRDGRCRGRRLAETDLDRLAPGCARSDAPFHVTTRPSSSPLRTSRAETFVQALAPLTPTRTQPAHAVEKSRIMRGFAPRTGRSVSTAPVQRRQERPRPGGPAGLAEPVQYRRKPVRTCQLIRKEPKRLPGNSTTATSGIGWFSGSSNRKEV